MAAELLLLVVDQIVSDVRIEAERPGNEAVNRRPEYGNGAELGPQFSFLDRLAVFFQTIGNAPAALRRPGRSPEKRL